MLESLQLNSILGDLTIKEAAFSLFPLLTFALSMIFYCLFVYKLYKLISTKDIVRISRGRGDSRLHKIAYDLEYIFLFPVVSFIWFFVMAVILASLAQTVSTTAVFMVAMATLATVRVIAYYDENLAQDIAKQVPLTLLVVFLVDLTNVQSNALLLLVSELPSFRETLVYYFLFIVGLELILRLFSELEWRSKSGERVNLRPRA